MFIIDYLEIDNNIKKMKVTFYPVMEILEPIRVFFFFLILI